MSTDLWTDNGTPMSVRALLSPLATADVVACGDTADMVEAAVLPAVFRACEEVPVAGPWPRCVLFKVHLSIDTDAVSTDHVLFVFAEGRRRLTSFESYVQEHPARFVPRPPDFFAQLQRMDDLNDADAWCTLFSVERRPELFANPHIELDWCGRAEVVA